MKTTLLFIILLCTTGGIKAQESNTVNLENISKQFRNQLAVFPQEKVYIHVDRYFYTPGDTVWCKIYRVNASSNISLSDEQPVYIELVSPEDSVVSRVKIIPRNDSYYGYLPVSQDLHGGDYWLRAYTPYMTSSSEDYFFKRNIYISGKTYSLKSESTLDFDVSFFPEGGYLLQGAHCYVGFKALNTKGLGEKIEGTVVDDAGNFVSTIESNPLGMGVFAFTPVAGRRYYAICKIDQGEAKRFELPVAQTKHYSLQAKWNNDRLMVSVLHSDDLKGSHKPLYLVMHTRGKVYDVVPWDHSKDFIAFKKELFPSGILHLLLLDEEKNILSERLLFCLNDDQVKVLYYTDKENYSPKSKVVSTVKLSDKNGLPLTGNFSVSITDDNATYIDTTSTILSNLLLTSELKGYIENPAYYFRNGRSSMLALDYVMLTQGWRRYDIQHILKDNYVYPNLSWSGERFLTGYVRSDYRVEEDKKAKPVQHSVVTAMSAVGDYFAEGESDAMGRFTFRLPDFPDSTLFRIQAKPTKKVREVGITMEDFTYPAIGKRPLVSVTQDIEDIQLIDLEEINVTARRKEKTPPPPSVFTRLATSSITSDYFDSRSNLSWDQVLRLAPKRGPSSLTQSRGVLILINDMSMGYGFDLEEISIYDVERIDFISPVRSSIFGSEGIGGAISVTTKSGPSLRKGKPPVVKMVLPLGYQEPVEFYSPRYEFQQQNVGSKQDLRSTLYWNPVIQADSNGKAQFDFYTADATSTYTVIVEGITSKGKIVYQTAKIIND